MKALLLAAIRAIIIDFDGTVARGSQPLPGLDEFFVLLHQRQIAFTIATNNTGIDLRLAALSLAARW